MQARTLLLALALAWPSYAEDGLPDLARRRLTVRDDGEGGLWSVTFSPDGETLAFGGSLKKVHLFDVKSGKLLRSFGTHLDRVWAVAWSNDGKLLCSGGRADLTLRAWDPLKGEELKPFVGHRGGITRICFFHDGKRVIMSGGSWDPTIRVWSIHDREQLLALSGHSDYIDSMDLASHGRLAVSGSRDGSLRLWSLTRGREVFVDHHPGENAGYAAVAFSPDGRTFASGGFNGQFQVRETITRSRCLRLSEGNGIVRAIAFSPDGQHVAFTSDAPQVNVWDTRTGKEVRIFRGHEAPIQSLGFSPDGKLLASSSSDGFVILWDIPAPADLSRRLKDDERVNHVTQLGSDDAIIAHQAVVALSHDSGPAVAALAARLKPAVAGNEAECSKWIEELGSPRYADRDRAMLALERAGEAAEASLRRALAAATLLEQKLRLEQLLDRLERGPPIGEARWQLRAIAVLEARGDAEARRILKGLAAGATGFRLTIEAAEALERLGKCAWANLGIDAERF
jgi:WD40 repeat protein